MTYQLKWDDSGPSREWDVVTPSDSTEYGRAARGLYVGTGGSVVLVDAQSSKAVTFVAVPGGVILPVWHRRVNSTGTTASNLVALF